MTRLPHSKRPHTRRSPGSLGESPSPGPTPLGVPRPSRCGPHPPAFLADLLFSWPPLNPRAVPRVPPAPRDHPSPSCHGLRDFPHPRPSPACRELRPREEAPSQGHTGSEQGPDPASGLPSPRPLAALPATRILGEAGSPTLFPDLSTRFLLLPKRPLPFQRRPALLGLPDTTEWF